MSDLDDMMDFDNDPVFRWLKSRFDDGELSQDDFLQKAYGAFCMQRSMTVEQWDEFGRKVTEDAGPTSGEPS